MKDEYIIVNKTAIQKRIEELRELEDSTDRIIYADKFFTRRSELVQLLSQSTPLIPEIEKAFDAGYDLNTFEQLEIPNEERDCLNTQDYIDNLKLEI